MCAEHCARAIVAGYIANDLGPTNLSHCEISNNINDRLMQHVNLSHRSAKNMCRIVDLESTNIDNYVLLDLPQVLLISALPVSQLRCWHISTLINSA